MGGAKDLSIYQLLTAYLFVVILIVIVKIRNIPREKLILLSSIRMTLQLILTGYILIYVFKYPNVIITIVILLVMETFSVMNIIKTHKANLTGFLKKSILISMFAGSISTLLFFIIFVVKNPPWYSPQYFIPLSGMFIGNSMTGLSLAVSRLITGMDKDKNLIETYLMLGASPKRACKDIVNTAFDSAILPTVNSMLGMGIVFLPGMMTGQILSGSSPLVAIKYQIAIMLGILGSVSITVLIFLYLGFRNYFNDEAQLIEKE
ncbi:MAG: iron export ABC transporter permease subunit FetB [Clostridiaceae bacterium]